MKCLSPETKTLSLFGSLCPILFVPKKEIVSLLNEN